MNVNDDQMRILSTYFSQLFEKSRGRYLIFEPSLGLCQSEDIEVNRATFVESEGNCQIRFYCKSADLLDYENQTPKIT